MADENILGGGLDVEGWIHHKQQVAQKYQGNVVLPKSISLSLYV